MEFMICTNTGEEAKPLAKIASGGELARIMLAIKNVPVSYTHLDVYKRQHRIGAVSGAAALRAGGAGDADLISGADRGAYHADL